MDGLQVNAVLKALELGAPIEVAFNYAGLQWGSYLKNRDEQLDILIAKAQATFVVDRLRALTECPAPQVQTYLLGEFGPDRTTAIALQGESPYWDDEATVPNPKHLSIDELLEALAPAIEQGRIDLARLVLSRLAED